MFLQTVQHHKVNTFRHSRESLRTRERGPRALFIFPALERVTIKRHRLATTVLVATFFLTKRVFFRKKVPFFWKLYFLSLTFILTADILISQEKNGSCFFFSHNRSKIPLDYWLRRHPYRRVLTMNEQKRNQLSRNSVITIAIRKTVRNYESVIQPFKFGDKYISRIFLVM